MCCRRQDDPPWTGVTWSGNPDLLEERLDLRSGNQDVGVTHSFRDVPQDRLHVGHAGARFHQPCCKSVAGLVGRVAWKSHLVRLDPVFEGAGKRSGGPGSREGRVCYPAREQRDCAFLLGRWLVPVLLPKPLKRLGLTRQDDVVDGARDLDRVVKFADLRHIHPHPGLPRCSLTQSNRRLTTSLMRRPQHTWIDQMSAKPPSCGSRSSSSLMFIGSLNSRSTGSLNGLGFRCESAPPYGMPMMNSRES